MKNLNFCCFCFYFSIFIFLGCGKKPNSKLGGTYYKSCLLELSDKAAEPESLKKALFFIDHALDHEKNPKYLALKASLLFQLGKIKEGDELFNQVLISQIDPGFKAETLNNYACLLAQQGQAERALLIWSELKDNKDYLTPEVAVFNQSKIYILQNNYEKAKDRLQETLFIAPSFLDAHYCLALVAFRLNDFALCKEQVSTILYLEPDHQGAKKLLDSLSMNRNH